MDSFTTWMLKGLHAKQEKSRLSQISNMIDWAPFRQILEEMYDNKSEKGGRPNCDVILMFKILILQKWHGLSDLGVERQMADRISFMAFLDYPDPLPDSRTIWLFKQRIAESGKGSGKPRNAINDIRSAICLSTSISLNPYHF